MAEQRDKGVADAQRAYDEAVEELYKRLPEARRQVAEAVAWSKTLEGRAELEKWARIGREQMKEERSG